MFGVKLVACQLLPLVVSVVLIIWQHSKHARSVYCQYLVAANILLLY